MTFVDGSPAKPSDLAAIRGDGPRVYTRCQHGSAWPSTPTNGTAPKGKLLAGTLLADSMGLGKGSPVWAKLLTPHGWTTYGEIKVGDQLIGQNGQPTTVIGVFPRGELDVYRVTMSDGSSVVVDCDHLSEVTTRLDRVENRHPSVRSTSELMQDSLRVVEGGVEKHVAFIPVVEPVHFELLATSGSALARPRPARAPAR